MPYEHVKNITQQLVHRDEPYGMLLIPNKNLTNTIDTKRKMKSAGDPCYNRRQTRDKIKHFLVLCE
jgi:hypothetical protein